MKKLTILCVGALLCLLKPKAKRLKLGFVLAVVLFCCTLNAPLWAQNRVQPVVALDEAALKVSTLPVDTINPLLLQQQIPQATLDGNFEVIGANGKVQPIKLSATKSKLIILDFWATWCTACLQKFAHLDSLSTQFKGQAQIILVNANIKGDTEAKIQNRLKGYGLKSIIRDNTLKALFPHEFIPHYVWLDEKGMFLALTNADMVNERTIASYLNKK